MKPMSSPAEPYFLPYQQRWLDDNSRLKIMEKSRQIGLSYTAAYTAVRRAIMTDARHDIWVSSRDDLQSRLFLKDCQFWAGLLNQACEAFNLELADFNASTASILQFANGRRIYSLSSNPNALAGKRGHVILDEFALHPDQERLYQVALPVITWGGQLEIISTHRGADSFFNRILDDIKAGRTSTNWSHHRVPLEDAVAQGLVERINQKREQSETRPEFIERCRRDCLTDDAWFQEYCCTPAQANGCFLNHDDVIACSSEKLDVLHPTLERLCESDNLLYLGVDVGRLHDLTVFDVGEVIDKVAHDRLRLVLKKRPFAEIEHWLRQLTRMRRLVHTAIDATGLGMQIAEVARTMCSCTPVTFTADMKTKLAYQLRHDFERRRLRISPDEELRRDLLSVQKAVNAHGGISIAGNTPDGHCDRFWALALRQYAWSRVPGILRPMFLD